MARAQPNLILRSIRFENYRAFSDLTLDQFAMVNLFGGRNGVGKTTLLEGIFLFEDRKNPELLVRPLLWRSIPQGMMETSFIFTQIFHDFEKSRPTVINAETSIAREKRSFVYNDEFRPMIMSATRPGGLAAKNENGGSPELSISAVEGIDIRHTVKGKTTEVGHLWFDREKGFTLGFDKFGETAPSAVYIRPSRRTTKDLARRFSTLDSAGQNADLLSYIQKIQPAVSEISLLMMGDEAILHGDIGISRKLPLNLISDGLSNFVEIAIYIMTSPQSIVLVDEFENGIHHSALTGVWSTIRKMASDFECQIFATTHSWECVKAAHDSFREAQASNLFMYYRLDRDNEGKVVAKGYSSKALSSALRREWEIR